MRITHARPLGLPSVLHTHVLRMMIASSPYRLPPLSTDKRRVDTRSGYGLMDTQP